MKTRIMMMAGFVAILASIGIWLGPSHLLAQTNGPSAGRKIQYYTCPMHPSVKSDKPGDCPYCGMTLEAVYQDGTGTNDASTNRTNRAAGDAKPKPYPFGICVVDGMKLDSMGGPYVFVYQGQEIKMCCANCKPAFMQNADQYMKEIQDGEAKQK